MNLTRDRIHSVGWAVVIAVCIVLVAVLTLRVNAVRSEVVDAEKRMVSIKREIIFLETEFQTRANQEQLRTLNRVEFGYEAPLADQYIEGERQLASLGDPVGPDAPKPIRVANARIEAEASPFMAFVSPITGQPAAAREAASSVADAVRGSVGRGATNDDVLGQAISAGDLDARLGRIELPEAAEEGQ